MPLLAGAALNLPTTRKSGNHLVINVLRMFGFDEPSIHYAFSGFKGDREFWAHLRDGDFESANAIVGVIDPTTRAPSGGGMSTTRRRSSKMPNVEGCDLPGSTFSIPIGIAQSLKTGPFVSVCATCRGFGKRLDGRSRR